MPAGHGSQIVTDGDAAGLTSVSSHCHRGCECNHTADIPPERTDQGQYALRSCGVPACYDTPDGMPQVSSQHIEPCDRLCRTKSEPQDVVPRSLCGEECTNRIDGRKFDPIGKEYF